MRTLPFLLLTLLSACGDGGYWTQTTAPVPVKVVEYVDYPCAGRNTRGCWNPMTQTMQIKTNLSPSDEACTYRHEMAHANGWTHPVNQALEWDCGPKEFRFG